MNYRRKVEKAPSVSQKSNILLMLLLCIVMMNLFFIFRMDIDIDTVYIRYVRALEYNSTNDSS